MAHALRLLRILVATMICLIVLVWLGGFLRGVLLTVLRDSINPFASAAWDMAFRAPGMLFYFTIPVAAVGFVMDRLSVDRWYYYVALWLSTAWIGHSGAALLSGPLTGMLYWILAGRVAGKSGVSAERIASVPRHLLNLLGYAALGYFAYVVVGMLYFGGKLVWVTAFPPSPGVPPFATQYEHQMTTRMKVAMMDYPNPLACLEGDAEANVKEDLKRLDWDRIETPAEATVCIFRLLGSFGDISRSDEWLEAQGFRVGRPGFNAEKPYVERDGLKRVAASWSIRENGPRFPTRGLLRRKLYSIPYGMNVNTTWSSDGQTLLYVELGFNTL